jgi:MurNAc alpha-1-phosphate uridylyltransferase
MSDTLPGMIFAAGFGTRMRPLTDRLPKPLIAVAGRPLIDHARDLLREAGVRRVVSNLHYLPDALEAHLAGSEVQTLRESPDILDTGGGLRHAVPLLGPGPVITINPDALWRGPNPVALALAQWDPARMDALLVCVAPGRALGTDSAGDFQVAPDGLLRRAPGAIYGGVQIVKTDRLAEIAAQAFSLNLLWDLLISDARCFGMLYPGQWCDVGHPGGITLGEAMLEGRA